MQKEILFNILATLTFFWTLQVQSQSAVADSNPDFSSSDSGTQTGQLYLHAKFLDPEGKLAVEFGPESLPVSGTNVLSTDTFEFCLEWETEFATFKNHPNYSALPEVFDEFTNFLELQVIGEMICGSPNPDLDNMLTALGAAQRKLLTDTTPTEITETTCSGVESTVVTTNLNALNCWRYLERQNGDISVTCKGRCKNYYGHTRKCIEASRTHHRCTCPLNKGGGAHYPPIPCTCGGKCVEIVVIGSHPYKKNVPCRRFYLSLPECNCKLQIPYR